MILDLSNHEIELIDSALKVWSQQPMADGMSSSLIGAMFRGPNHDRERLGAEIKAEIAEAKSETQQRERQVLLLRAKLLQAQTRQSEHDVETKEAPENPGPLKKGLT